MSNRGAGFEVAAERCDQCLFGKDRIVSGQRMEQVLSECRKKDTHFVCHKFSMVEGSSNVCCRGFYETQPPTQLMRIAERLGCINDVEIPTYGK